MCTQGHKKRHPNGHVFSCFLHRFNVCQSLSWAYNKEVFNHEWSPISLPNGVHDNEEEQKPTSSSFILQQIEKKLNITFLNLVVYDGFRTETYCCWCCTGRVPISHDVSFGRRQSQRRGSCCCLRSWSRMYPNFDIVMPVRPKKAQSLQSRFGRFREISALKRQLWLDYSTRLRDK